MSAALREALGALLGQGAAPSLSWSAQEAGWTPPSVEGRAAQLWGMLQAWSLDPRCAEVTRALAPQLGPGRVLLAHLSRAAACFGWEPSEVREQARALAALGLVDLHDEGPGGWVWLDPGVYAERERPLDRWSGRFEAQAREALGEGEEQLRAWARQGGGWCVEGADAQEALGALRGCGGRPWWVLAWDGAQERRSWQRAGLRACGVWGVNLLVGEGLFGQAPSAYWRGLLALAQGQGGSAVALGGPPGVEGWERSLALPKVRGDEGARGEAQGAGFAGLRRVAPIVERPVVSPEAWEALRELEGWLGKRKELAAMMGRHWPTGALVALLHGPAGAGKTTCASYLCERVGVPLYELDVQKVMSKYIGEGIKKWDQALTEAERRGCALLVRDAEGVFAPRVKVHRSVDRYSNQEVNFLLQRLEVFEGVLLLTSTRASKMDSAFARRIQHRLELGLPGVAQRAELWRRWGAGAVKAREHHWVWLAEQLELGPGDIQQAVLRALCAAKAQGEAPTVHHLWRSARQVAGR